jgi:hypothetical protein
MAKADTAAISLHLHPEVRLWTSVLDESGVPTIQKGSVQGWLEGVANAKAGALDERLLEVDVRVDADRLASAWTPYRFYYDNAFSHCGSNSFQLAKVGSSWLITSIMDSRRREQCMQAEELIKMQKNAINQLLDQWHKDAATGSFDSYFNAMSEASYFLGTDETEVWDKQTFMEFSKPHFADGEGWVFTTKRRNIHLADDLQTAWFDEDLDTWMGVCRGSGVLHIVKGEWKITHYVLSVAVPNDKINDYNALFEK